MMSIEPIQWDEAGLSLGLTESDNQHSELVATVNKLIESRAADAETRLDNLRLVLTFARYHFAAEEELLICTGYPDLEAHHREHRRFLTTLAAFNRDFRNGSKDFGDPILVFIKDWTVHHILNEDRGFARWMANKGISPSTDDTGSRGCPPFVSTDEVKGITGIPEIDRQHEEMVRLLNWVRCYSTLPDSRKVWMGNRIRVLYFYSRHHFFTEEVLQRRAGFPRAAEHRIQHEELLARAREFITGFSNGRTDLTEGILNFFRAWTLQHILVEDSRMLGMKPPTSG
jgi:hemerythrin